MKEQDIILIEQYLEGMLDETSKQAFKKRLQEEPAFKKQFEEHQALVKGLEFALFQDEYAKMEQFHQELQEESFIQDEDIPVTPVPKQSTPVVTLRRVISIAAVFAAGLFVAQLLPLLFQGETETFGGEGISLLIEKEIPLTQLNTITEEVQQIVIPTALYESDQLDPSVKFENDVLSLYIPQLSKRLTDLNSQTNIELILQDLNDSLSLPNITILIIDSKTFSIPLNDETLTQILYK